MQVEIKIDRSCPEPRLIILTAEMTEDVNTILTRLSSNIPPVISGYKDDKVEVLEPADLIRIYANSGKVFAI